MSMRAVVVDIKNGYAALLQDDGTVVRKRNENYSIGDVVVIRKKSLTGKFKVAAAAAMFFIIASVGVAAYETPYYYVSMDVNPGIIMEVNIFEKVISIEAVNEDAQAIMDGLEIRNKGIETALCNAVERIEEEGYFENNNDIIIAASCKNEGKADRLALRLQERIENEVQEKGIEADVDSRGVGYEMVQQARQWSITPGKYNIITHLLDEEVNENNTSESIKSLMTRYTSGKGNRDTASDKESGDIENYEQPSNNTEDDQIQTHEQTHNNSDNTNSDKSKSKKGN